MKSPLAKIFKSFQNIFKKKKKKYALPVGREAEVTLLDFIAPSSIKIQPMFIRLGGTLAKSYFVFSYPRYLTRAWLSPIINLDIPLTLSFFFHPTDTGYVLKQLQKRLTEIQAEIAEREEKGLIRDPTLETAHHDIEELRDKLQTGQERMFRFGLYLTLYAEEEKELKDIETVVRSNLESKLVYIKPCFYQQKQGLHSCFPYGLDQVMTHHLMNTSPLSSVFPFVSSDLSANEGILYGINQHNKSLVLFNRFSLENANMVVFAKSGSGKSYAVKLETLRLIMTGIEVIIIDPENEYKPLAEAVGGSFVNISLSSPNHVNPFDLPEKLREDEKPEDVLRSNVINLVGLLRLMLGGLTPEEDSIIDRALTETYAAKDITPETDPSTWKENIPLLEDLESVLEGMEGAESVLRRLRKFTKGTYSQFFNQPTNVALDKPLVVFGIRDLEDALRPMAMFVIMRYIWNKVRSEIKRRILVVDEAWWLMQYEDSASFLFGLCKRGRKYGLGVTTITQDVNDFMKSTYGQPIITNSALQLLMKQSPATIDVLQKAFNLTEEEKYLLLGASVGEGLFFAGPKHVLLRVEASYTEHQIITTSPEEVKKIRERKKKLELEEEKKE